MAAKTSPAPHLFQPPFSVASRRKFACGPFHSIELAVVARQYFVDLMRAGEVRGVKGERVWRKDLMDVRIGLYE